MTIAYAVIRFIIALPYAVLAAINHVVVFLSAGPTKVRAVPSALPVVLNAPALVAFKLPALNTRPYYPSMHTT